MGAVADAIAAKLTTAFSPTQAGDRRRQRPPPWPCRTPRGGESHFNLLIEAQAFAGKARVARQRLIFQALAEEMAGPVHALSIVAKAPGEA
jgi:BolA protein